MRQSYILKGSISDIATTYLTLKDFSAALEDGKYRQGFFSHHKQSRERSEKYNYPAFDFINKLYAFGFGDLDIVLEYAIPGTRRVVDAIVFGQRYFPNNKRDNEDFKRAKRQITLVEFKSWTDKDLSNYKAFQPSYLAFESFPKESSNGKGYGSPHPLFQVESYRDFLARFNEISNADPDVLFRNICYLPNLTYEESNEKMCKDDAGRTLYGKGEEFPLEEGYFRYLIYSDSQLFNFFAHSDPEYRNDGDFEKNAFLASPSIKRIVPSTELMDMFFDSGFVFTENAIEFLGKMIDRNEDWACNDAFLDTVREAIIEAFREESRYTLFVDASGMRFAMNLLRQLLSDDCLTKSIILKADDGNIRDLYSDLNDSEVKINSCKYGKKNRGNINVFNAFKWDTNISSIDAEIVLVCPKSKSADGKSVPLSESVSESIAEAVLSFQTKAKVLVFLIDESTEIDERTDSLRRRDMVNSEHGWYGHRQQRVYKAINR